MTEHDMIWRIFASLNREMGATSAIARAIVKWAKENRKTLKLAAHTKTKPINWRVLGDEAAKRVARNAKLGLFDTGERLAAALRLDAADAALLRSVVAIDRDWLTRRLMTLLAGLHVEQIGLLGSINGLGPTEANTRLTRGELQRLGLVESSLGKDGKFSITASWNLNRLLDRATGDEDSITEMLIGQRQAARLPLSGFARLGQEADFIIRLIKGALASRAPGINILLYGPPGTGKTELARTMAGETGAQLFSVGEADEDGAEPNRWDRVTAFRLAQRVAERRTETLLLFDEMEDLIGNAERSGEDYFSKRDGSKIFVNRLLETNAAPTIWTTNAIGNIDPAILRRMSYVLKLDYPTPEAARAMLDLVAADEAVMLSDGGLTRLTAHAPEAGTVLRNALRAGRLAGGGEVDATRAAGSLVASLRGENRLRVPNNDPANIDLSLYEAGQNIETLLARLASDATPDDFSLLLTGPPGTGKTALAHHLAHRLDRPLIVKRASDLLSKWVGETEQQIAEAFDEAINRNGVLLFDEVDSLLYDRSSAKQSWEVTQVNELLTWFDSHPLPFIAATNHGHKLDPAAARRFVFKLDLKPLPTDKVALAYRRFFKAEAPMGLSQLHGLTPGDLAVVARQLRYRDAGADVVALLAAELAAKPEGGGRIGF